jgi:hypothetical protein
VQPRTAHLIEILLPLASNEGEPFGRALYDMVRDELLSRFGGVTMFSRSPAEGSWAGGAGEGASCDRVISVEVMADDIDPDWWSAYRVGLERRFGQESIVVRASEVTLL